ncbi:MAG: DUF1080 domain-containing protein, partial [Planctomycetaceae bacterium]|nr:DUF1080 domain-containing protein [Planctomycetaceae bacterium]
RIAVAGLEAVQKASPEFPAWAARVESDRNPDGTWGKGPGRARDTGGAAVALLRMGVAPDKEDAILAALREGQRPDGGWGEADGGSDLESTYRVMRAFFMLEEKPDLKRLREFLARCRQSDGGYAVKPGDVADVVGTYYATTVFRWTRLLEGEPALIETAGFVPLCNGKDLGGWEGDSSLWSVRDGMLVGISPGIKRNNFLATEKSYGNFILQLSFRLIGGDGNSGVQFRSVRISGHEMAGYQADIGQDYWGCLYDESRRNRVLERASPRALETLNKTGWNRYEVRAMGDRIRLSLNGDTSVEYREEDPAIARDGRIAFQIHAGGPMEIQFKDIQIQPLPSPTPCDDTQPGFHLRTVKTDQGARRYAVYVPVGYDGKEPFPVALFLHGSGERGDDGTLGSMVGLGAAIYGHPEDYPMIAVFPQARESWRAESDDAKSALAALDDVLSTFKTDRDRVILTGQSMGGSGSWSLAAAHPERFAAVVPICGRGRTDTASTLKALPVWSLVGDADREETVLGTRAMIEALRAAGGSARLTEYRGLGHTCWDRAYNDPNLIDWMLAQKAR